MIFATAGESQHLSGEFARLFGDAADFFQLGAHRFGVALIEDRRHIHIT
jgi:hypothetical protein